MGATGTTGTIYRMPMWDVTTPAFVSGTSYAYGTEDDLSHFMSVRRGILDRHAEDTLQFGGDEPTDGLLDAWEDWKAGDKSVTVNVAYKELPFLEPVEVLGDAVRIDEGHHEETYLNTYGCPYNVQADGISWEVIVVGCGDGRFLRVVKAQVTGMSLDGALGDGRRMLVSSSWGEPGTLDIQDEGEVSTTVFLAESAYGDKEAALASLSGEPRLSLSPVMEQVVADG